MQYLAPPKNCISVILLILSVVEGSDLVAGFFRSSSRVILVALCVQEPSIEHRALPRNQNDPPHDPYGKFYMLLLRNFVFISLLLAWFLRVSVSVNGEISSFLTLYFTAVMFSFCTFQLSSPIAFFVLRRMPVRCLGGGRGTVEDH